MTSFVAGQKPVGYCENEGMRNAARQGSRNARPFPEEESSKLKKVICLLLRKTYEPSLCGARYFPVA
jgi:hypothetical protein